MSTAAVINLIQHVRRLEGSAEDSGAVIPKAEGRGVELFWVLSNPFAPSPSIAKPATVTEP